MTKNDFDQIILKARKLFEEGKESYNLPDLKEDAAMWNVVMGDAYPTSDVDPNVVYDMFLGAFVLSKTMDKIPWNDNVHVYEGWKDKKDKAWFVNDSMEGILKDGPKRFRFSANSCIDGVFGPLPLKKQEGWRFEVVFVRSKHTENRVDARISVWFKNKTEDITPGLVRIQQAQLALVTFLKAAREKFSKK